MQQNSSSATTSTPRRVRGCTKSTCVLILGIATFICVVVLLSSTVHTENHIIKHQPRFRRFNHTNLNTPLTVELAAQHRDNHTNNHVLKVNDQNLVSNGKSADDLNLDTKLPLTTHEWVITAWDGVVVCKTRDLCDSNSRKSDIISVLPAGLMVIGESAVEVIKTPIPSYRDAHNKESAGSSATILYHWRMKIIFPVTGYITIQTATDRDITQNTSRGKHDSHSMQYRHNVRLLNITTTVRQPSTPDSPQKDKSQAETSQCHNISTFLLDTDFRGGDLTVVPNPQGTSTSSDCCVLCHSISSCARWTYAVAGKQCWLKSAAVFLVELDTKHRQSASHSGITRTMVDSGILVSGSVTRDSTAAVGMINADVDLHQQISQHISSSQCCSYDGDGLKGGMSLFTHQQSVTHSTPPNTGFRTYSVSDLNPALITSLDRLLGVYTVQAAAAQALPQSASQPYAREHIIEPNPYIKHMQYTTSHGDWTETVPIGNGLFGALLSETLNYDFIPISVSGMYIKPRGMGKKGPEINKQLLRTEATGSNDNPTDGAVFRKAREAFLNKQYVESENLINSLIIKDSPLGMFQYLLDLTVAYSPEPFVVKDHLYKSKDTSALFPKAAKKRPREVNYNSGGGGGGVGGVGHMLATFQKPEELSLTAEAHKIMNGLNFGAGRNQLLNRLHHNFNYTSTTTTGTTGQQPQAGQQTPNRPPLPPHALNAHKHNRPRFGPLLYSDHILDMKNGISHSLYVEERVSCKDTVAGSAEDKAKHSELYIHNKEWFASGVDNVMVGTISCHQGKMSDKEKHNSQNTGHSNQPGCLNIALQISRESSLNTDSSPTVMHTVDVYQGLVGELWIHDNDANVSTDGVKFDMTSSSAFEFTSTLQMNGHTQTPPAVTFGIVVCVGRRGDTGRDNNTGTLTHSVSESGADFHSYILQDEFSHDYQTIVCNNAERVHTITTVETSVLSDNSPIKGDALPSSAEVSRLETQARLRVSDALQKGLTALRRDHTAEFSKIMDEVDIDFDINSESDSDRKYYNGDSKGSAEGPSADPSKSDIKLEATVCTNSQVSTRLANFDSVICNYNGSQSVTRATATATSAAVVGTQTATTTDTALVSTLYQYGRYLAHSSATRSVPNLQGLWADGVNSVWNGDYHLNINLQMNYWGIEAAGLGPHTIAPLREFVRKMAKNGQQTARTMYGVGSTSRKSSAWVAHGFTDSDMNMGLHGESQWSLCVTCGAWMALQLWEHILYNPLIVVSGDKADQTEHSAVSNLFEDVIPTFRGVAEFFLEYMHREELSTGVEGNENGESSGRFVMHTGPTTSPENSYTIVSQQGDSTGIAPPAPVVRQHPSHPAVPPVPPTLNRVNYLTMSPAIDMSVLRQASTAFTLSTQWARRLLKENSKHYPPGDNHRLSYIEADSDRTLARKFQDLVSHMPNQALPVIAAPHKDNDVILDSSCHRSSAGASRHVTPPEAARKIVGNTESIGWEAGSDESSLCLVVREYPAPLGVTSSQLLNMSAQRPTDPAIHPADSYPVTLESISETDAGHRHFSSMHWLYPNTFLPLMGRKQDPEQHNPQRAEYLTSLFAAAKNTMAVKRNGNGGHTGWSVVWQACLYARLHDSENLYHGLVRLMTKYITPSLLALHPPLAKKGPQNCGTCFQEDFQGRALKEQQKQAVIQQLLQRLLKLKVTDKPHHGEASKNGSTTTVERLTRQIHAQYVELLLSKMSQADTDSQHEADSILNVKRGLVTAGDEKFQIDANLGFLAVVHEMLVQSHVPNFLYLLPALPRQLSRSGRFMRMKVRGDMSVSLVWRNGRVQAARVVFNSNHPWLLGVTEVDQHSGFYYSSGASEGANGALGSNSEERESFEMNIASPNALQVYTLESGLFQSVGDGHRGDGGTSTSSISGGVGSHSARSSNGCVSDVDSTDTEAHTTGKTTVLNPYAYLHSSPLKHVTHFRVSKQCLSVGTSGAKVPVVVYLCDTSLSVDECHKFQRTALD